MKKTIIHFDSNNFFCSVEMLRNPALRGRAVAVCGDPKKRHGIVLAKSEPAKARGVTTGMTIWQAKNLCPDLEIVATNHADYEKYSKIIQQVYIQYTDLVEPFGIDECWLDVTQSLAYFKTTARELADTIRNRIRNEIGLTVSAGVAWNKTLAKLASDIKKPDATTVIDREYFDTVVQKMPASDLLFIGKKTARVLERLNIHTIGDLARADERVLAGHFGINARKMVEMARGIDDEPVKPFDHKREIKSVGNGTTLGADLTTARQVETVVYMLADKVTTRMRRKGVKGSTIHVSVRDTNLEWRGAQETLCDPTSNVQTVLKRAMEIFNRIWTLPAPVRSIRISVSKLTHDARAQMSLFDTKAEERGDRLSTAFDAIRAKHGANSIAHGIAENIVIEDIDDEELD